MKHFFQLSCVLLITCPILRLSYLTFVPLLRLSLSYVCPIRRLSLLRLSHPTFVPSHVCHSYVCPSTLKACHKNLVNHFCMKCIFIDALQILKNISCIKLWVIFTQLMNKQKREFLSTVIKYKNWLIFFTKLLFYQIFSVSKGRISHIRPLGKIIVYRSLPFPKCWS